MPITDKPSPATRAAFHTLANKVGIVQARQIVSDEIRAKRGIVDMRYGARPRQDAFNGTVRRSTRSKLDDDDLAQIRRSIADGMTLREVAKAMWRDKGFSSLDSAVQCMRTALQTRG